MIDKIPTLPDPGDKIEEQQRAIGDAILRGNAKRKRIAKGIINYAGILVGVFIVFVVIVALTTKIRFAEKDEMGFSELGLNFFILLFASYSMYLANADSGQRAGYISDSYISEKAKFEELKKTIIDNKIQARLADFCHDFAIDELKMARSSVLANVGLKYERYEEEWMGEDETFIDDIENISKAQKKAIKEANRMKLIKLTPDMILRRGRGSTSRTLLGMSPEKKKSVKFSTRFLQLLATSLIMSMTIAEMVQEPTWRTFVSIAIRVFFVVLNGFFGYKFGYENIAVYTSSYMRDQSDLMHQFLQWNEQNPEILEEE